MDICSTFPVLCIACNGDSENVVIDAAASTQQIDSQVALDNVLKAIQTLTINISMILPKNMYLESSDRVNVDKLIDKTKDLNILSKNSLETSKYSYLHEIQVNYSMCDLKTTSVLLSAVEIGFDVKSVIKLFDKICQRLGYLQEQLSFIEKELLIANEVLPILDNLSNHSDSKPKDLSTTLDSCSMTVNHIDNNQTTVVSNDDKNKESTDNQVKVDVSSNKKDSWEEVIITKKKGHKKK